MDIKKGKDYKNMPESYWIASTKGKDYFPLERNIDVEIAIVGGEWLGYLQHINWKKAVRK